MRIYYLLIVFIVLLYILTWDIKNKFKRNKIITILSSIAIILIQGLRHINVGHDVKGYLLALNLTNELNFLKGDKLFNYEIGYSLYSKIFATLEVSETQYLLIVAATIIVPISYIWMKNSKMPALSIIIYITLGFFTFSFSGLRQSIAIAITFFSFKLIQERKLFRFLACILLAMSFHSSAIIFVAAYPLYNFRIRNKHFSIIIPAFLIVFLLKERIFLLIYKLYKGYDGIIDQTNAYTMMGVMIIVFILAWFFGRRSMNDRNYNAYQNYMLIAIFTQIFASQSNIIMRAGYSYYIFITLLIPEVIKNQKDPYFRMLANGILVFMLLYFFQKTTGNGYLNVSPYLFYWQ